MIESRKEDHMRICLEEKVEIEKDYWNMVKLFHNAAPEVDHSDISLETEFLGKKLEAPIMISAITGGYAGARKVNERLAYAAEKIGIPFGVGSQRAALENEDLRKTYEVIKEYDPPLVIGNIGAPQLIPQEGSEAFGIEKCEEAMKMIGGHYLAVHFNYLQEVVQPEGDTKSEGVLSALSKICDELPVIAKETGAGISEEMAVSLTDTGVKAIDVGGMGGTSFSAVEYYRQGVRKEIAEALWDWGIPTPVSILECRRSSDLPLISTGGIRTGIDIAKAISLGADIAGIAGGVLPSVTSPKEEVIKYLRSVIAGLRATMFLTGCRSVDDLKKRRVILTGELIEWTGGD